MGLGERHTVDQLMMVAFGFGKALASACAALGAS